MNKLMVLAGAVMAGILVAQAKTSTPEGWIDDYDLALKRAAEENKYVLLMIDSPSDKKLLSEKAAKQNPGLVDAYAKGTSEKVIDEVMKKLPSPDDPVTDAEKSRRRKQIQEACQEAFFAKVFAKYMPIYDKAFAEAHAMKVPPHMEAKKAELIDRQESRYKQMRSAYEDYMKSRKSDKD